MDKDEWMTAQRKLEAVDRLLLPAVEATLAALPLTPADGAAAELARQYARAIDTYESRAMALAKLGPFLLNALKELGATPGARAAALKGTTDAAATSKSPLAALRSARRSA
jgi:hypothetical protein